VNRDDIAHGAAGLGVEVDDLITDVIAALTARATTLGIAGVPTN